MLTISGECDMACEEIVASKAGNLLFLPEQRAKLVEGGVSQ